MTMMKVGDVACIEIFGTKFFIKHEGGGFGIYRDTLDGNHCLAYMDGWYADPENASEPGELNYPGDPLGSLEGLFQMTVHDLQYGDAIAKVVWRDNIPAVSVCDGHIEHIRFTQHGRAFDEIIMTGYKSPEEV